MSAEVKCNCQHCNGHIAFPAEMTGQTVSCPHCGLETKLIVPALNKPASAVPKDVRVEIKRGASPFGIAALVLGIISCIFCWIPFLGLLAVPLALIGLLLALVGLIMAGVNKKTGFVFPISGAVVCLLSVFIAFAVTGGLAAAFQKAVTEGKITNQETELKSNNQAASKIEEWSKSLSVKQGNIKVTVQKIHVGTVDNNDALGQSRVTQDELFAINLAVENLSPTKKVDFQTWRGLTFGGGPANLTDNSGNTYKRINITPSMDNGDSYPDTASIYPQKEQHDAIVFELPVENIKWLHLELPAGNFGGSGMLRFEISMSKISAAREELRIASTNYDYVSNFNHLMNNSDYTRIKTEADRLESSMGNLKFSTPNYDSIHRQMSRQWQSLQDQLRKIEQGAIAGPSKKLESAKFRLATAETNQLASPQ